jgi:hypothetical protein
MWFDSQVISSTRSKYEVTFCPCLFSMWWWWWLYSTLMCSEHYMAESFCRLVSLLITRDMLHLFRCSLYTSISLDIYVYVNNNSKNKDETDYTQFWCMVLKWSEYAFRFIPIKTREDCFMIIGFDSSQMLKDTFLWSLNIIWRNWKKNKIPNCFLIESKW